MQKRTGPTRALIEAVVAGNRTKLEGVPDLRAEVSTISRSYPRSCLQLIAKLVFPNVVSLDT